ncbi:hypothetical protein [Parachlamydia sp. AcF125]|uniref:hypothetical protein n=1 Tax=Parachlamydia sp. AcF125 TaxID=2795736 RepID=UPI001BC9506C|nr:hypothetical protein [Parachlamydia sp. AcF125]MBS4168763.1 hypothetical protein [Parachlamydia sp. AcF125]
MVRYEFPSGNQDPSSQKGNPHQTGGSTPQKLPEFIYIEDLQRGAEQEEIRKNPGEEKLYSSINQLEKKHYPWVLRAITFFASLFLLVAIPFLLVVVLCNALFAVGLLGKFEPFNRQTIRYWKQLKKATVIALGLFTATLSPAFGFGIILMYFVLQGEELNNSFLEQMMKSRRGNASPF